MRADGGHSGTPPDVLVSGRERRRERLPRWWPWLAGAALLLVGGILVLVVRPRLAASEFRGLQARWATADALDAERGQVIGQLAREATPSDVPVVAAAVLGLQRQEAGRLASLRAGMGPGLAHDGAVAALAAAERAVLGREIGALRGGRPLTGWSGATYVAIHRVQALLAAGQRSFGVPPPGPARPPRLTAADGTLFRLRRLLDSRVPDELLVSGDNGTPQVIDLESGSVWPAPPALRRLLANQPPGYTTFPLADNVVLQGVYGRVYAIPADLRPRRIGGGGALPAGRPDAAWIWNGGQPGRYMLVTVTGRRIAGPARGLARPDRLGAGMAVRGGLLVEHQQAANPAASTGLWLWNPLRGPALRPVVRGCAMPLAAHGTLLAWLRCGRGRASLRITDTATGATRTVANPPGAVPVLAKQATGYSLSPNESAAVFSPDGRWLAAYYSRARGDALGLVSTRTDAAQIIRGAPVPDATAATAIMWTPDSSRVFFGTGASGSDTGNPWADGTVPLATYRVGASSAQDVRLHEAGVTLLGVLAAPAG
jgi:hypothetical protein